ncbi:hypothetical protein FQR65_LT04308 [Abscondita terminalis]|nr:hypothetical protein FQR65_LT04308 [Abscondita terminalis]
MFCNYLHQTIIDFVIPRLWPTYVQKRIRATYFYFGSSLLVTAASAVVTFNRSNLIRLLVGRSIFFSFGLIVLTGMMVSSIPYKKGFGIKQALWLLHVVTIGTLLAPMCILGGAVLTQAASCTAGAIAGLSIVAICSPGKRFLSIGAPLGMGIGVIMTTTIASAFASPSSALGVGLYGITVYGGLILFSLFLLCDTQYIIVTAETYPVNHNDYGLPPYDPINSAMSIYADVLNIFSYIAAIVNDTSK